MKQSPTSAKLISALLGQTIYPEPFASLVRGRQKRKLGEHFGLTHFGVNLTHLSPGAVSALLHHHSKQEEFIFVLEGNPTLILGEAEYVLHPGDCYGFQAGTGIAHQLINRSKEEVTYLEIGDRIAEEQVEYPSNDLKATQLPNGQWAFTHQDGRPYESRNNADL